MKESELSRALSHALRHEPWRYELELDPNGWVEVDQVVEALRSLGPDWQAVDRDSIRMMIEHSAKKRHELDGSRIRAVYGHSVPQRVTYAVGDPPETLFHGTAPETAARILADGLRPMRRQYVHLAVDRETARAVGRRKDQHPVIVAIRAREAADAGVLFYATGGPTWLADHVPAAYIGETPDQFRDAEHS